ncbi:hypothetical protein SSAG_01404 [Streptomyces sp. Mg1]|nr:hypothetical protein SSAG_01404 [Streptomyces sp. Mg1]
MESLTIIAGSPGGEAHVPVSRIRRPALAGACRGRLRLLAC